MNGSGHQGRERSTHDDLEWVCLPKNHEKHAGNDNRGCYDARHGIVR
jgi:hypothetical protein